MEARSLLGQVITWRVVRDKVPSNDGTWKMVDPPPQYRTGTVWSAGPVTGTAWIIPDEPLPNEGRAVCVYLDPKEHRARKVDQQRSAAGLHAKCLTAMQYGSFIPAALIPSQPLPSQLERGA